MAEQEKETMGAKATMPEEDFDMDDEDEEKDREFVIRIRPPKLLPGEAKAHVRAARKEMLLAVRSVLDAMI